MFETAELGRKTSKSDFKEQVLELRHRLLTQQRKLAKTDSRVAVVLAGLDSAGRSEVANVLKEWFDVRFMRTHGFGRIEDVEDEDHRPEWWKYWRTLPARGSLAVYVGSWYTDTIHDRFAGRMKRAPFERSLARISAFEDMLVEDGLLLIKFWLHIPKGEQKRRLKKLAENPETAWRVDPRTKQYFKKYEKLLQVGETAIRNTDSGSTPWFLVEATDARYRDLTIGKTIAASLDQRLDEHRARRPSAPPHLGPMYSVPPTSVDSDSILDAVDLTQTIDAEDYDRRLKALQERTARLAFEAWERRVSTVLVFEGWDAAGKGGSIRRISRGIDARMLRVLSVGAPTDEEKAQHYLWRFWRHIPPNGHVTIYDRSWYGRVLVERVEGFAREDQWKRSYREINDFEEQLTDHGMVLKKFWLHISKDEQLRRFEQRKVTPHKMHKITDEDWRNREKWDDYEKAVNEMVARTSTSHAPWSLIAANSKKFARIQILDSIVMALERRLDE